jgi:hypothetical protein
MEMTMAKPKTNVKISVDEDDSLIDVMKKVIKALRHAGKDKVSSDFQRAVCSGGGDTDFMKVVNEYVIVES